MKFRCYQVKLQYFHIHLFRNHVYRERSKHIDIKLFWIWNKIEEGEVDLEKIPSEDNPSDAGTKVLSVSKFQHRLELLNMATA